MGVLNTIGNSLATAATAAANNIAPKVATAIADKGTQMAIDMFAGKDPFGSPNVPAASQPVALPAVLPPQQVSIPDDSEIVTDVAVSGWNTTECGTNGEQTTVIIPGCLTITPEAHLRFSQVSRLLATVGMQRQQVLALAYLLETFSPAEIAFVAR